MYYCMVSGINPDSPVYNFPDSQCFHFTAQQRRSDNHRTMFIVMCIGGKYIRHLIAY